MLNKTMFIIFFVLVSAGFAFLSSTQVGAEPPLVVTTSYVEGNLIKFEHGAFGQEIRAYFWDGEKWVAGKKVDLWVVNRAISAEDSIEDYVEDGNARLRDNSSTFFAEGSSIPCFDKLPCNLWP